MTTTFQYDHKTRKCEFPDCKNLGRAQGRHPSDGSLYRRAWCQFHQRGKGRDARREFAEGKKKYLPKDIKKTI